MVAFEIIWWKIHRYGIFYAISFLIWYGFIYYVWKSWIFESRKKLHELITKWIDDLFIAVIIGVLLWWRLWHILIYDLSYYIEHPVEIFMIWHGWMSFVWWVIGVIIGLFILKKIYSLNHDEFLLMIDSVVAIMPFWIMIWRIWNFLNQELYWIELSKLPENIQIIFKSIWFTHIYQKIDSSLRINTNFLESAFEWLLLLVINQIVFWKNYGVKPWLISWIFLIWYWLVRFIMEYLREYWNSEFIGIFTKTQYLMIIFIILWSYLIFRKSS